MARKIFIEIQDPYRVDNEQPTCFEDLLNDYINKKQELDVLDKLVKKLSDQVKAEMQKQNLKSTDKNGYKIHCIKSQRVTWNEDALLEKVKSFNKPELICTVEKVDVPNLEIAIINEEVDINEVKECQKVTEVVTLKMNKIKEVKTDE